MKISGTIFIFLMGVLMTAAAQVDELISDLVDGGKVARREAARSLALIGPEAKAAVPALARALDDEGATADEAQVSWDVVDPAAASPWCDDGKRCPNIVGCRGVPQTVRMVRTFTSSATRVTAAHVPEEM